MNTNNKEAIELLEQALKFGHINNVFSAVQAAIRILQDNEDTDVKEECRCIKAINHAEICSNCVVETRYHKPSSKVEKLKELRNGLVLSQMADRFVLPSELINLIDTLIEDEE